MKQRKTVPCTLLLPAGKLIDYEHNLFQYYKGDFFTLFVTQPGDVLVHEQLKQHYRDPQHAAHIQFRNCELIFEVYLHEGALDEYAVFSDITDMNTLFPFWSLGMEQAFRAFFYSPLKGLLAERFLYARVTDLLIQTAHHITALREEPVLDKNSIQLVTTTKEIILQDLSIYYSLHALARKAGTNATTLKKIFKRHYGVTLFQFSRQVRIDRAKELLKETNFTLQVIAEMVGYSEGNNFQVTFKKVVGCTPGEWRRGRYKDR